MPGPIGAMPGRCFRAMSPMTVIKLNKKHAGVRNQDVACAEAAQLLAYCILGHEQFAASNSA